MSSFTFADVCAGVGGFHLAMTATGGRCVFVSEKDKFARQTYLANFDIDFEIDEDITQTDMAIVPDFDVLCAGFPCQPFSPAGLEQGFEDIRGTLFFDLMRLAEAKQPKVILLENVKNLKSHDKGRTFKVILFHLEQLGYTVAYQILDTKDFGLPQSRKRIFIVAHKQDVDFEFPEPLAVETRIKSILEIDVSEKYTLSDKTWDRYRKRKEKHVAKKWGIWLHLSHA